ncbi:hypothetical protein [Vitreimonas sp.]|uniref:hypothetical protein n=1 Tax=Vitreimonas sp. TaxID=3069702 RepID=UPI002EDAE9A4
MEPLVILLLQKCGPLGEDTLGSVWSFVTLDTLHLSNTSADFFRKLEDICQQVVVGRLTQFDPDQVRGSEFDGYLHRYLGDGTITPGVRSAAERFLAFLAENPRFWPPSDSNR